VVAALLACTLASVPVRADTKSELNDAKAQLDDLIARIDSGQATIASLQADSNALVKKIDQVQTKITQTQARIVDVQKEIKQAQGELVATQDQLDRRAWVAYETGPGISVEFLLGSTSLSDLANRLEIVDRAAQSDKDLITQIQGLQTKLRQKRGNLRDLEDQQRTTRDGLNADYKDLQGKLAAQQAAVAQLEQDKADAAALVDKLDKKLQAEIEAEKRRLAELERQRREQEQQQHQGGGGGGGGNVSHHPFTRCPVAGAVGYSDDFGAPRYGGGFHPHAGNDMFASRGVPVVAPFDGTASDASNGLGGLAVKVFGAEGWVYNAHLDSIGTLGYVSAGTVIGTVGDTGDAIGGATHDHFEWHPNDVAGYASQWTSPYGYSQIGDAVDPYPYLNQAC